MALVNSRFYPSPSNVTYYIGDLLIDDIFRVDFQRKVSHQPVWGYDSSKYDFVAKGKEVVSGNIIIDYRYPGYLRAAIKKYYDNRKATGMDVEIKFKDPERLPYDATFLKSIDSLTLAQKASVISNQLVKGSSSNAAQVLLTQLKKDLNKVNGVAPLQDDIGGDNFYQSILDTGEIYPFDLTVRYGFQNTSGGYVRVFKDCIIIGESQTVNASAGMGDDLSSSAQPILEVYSFFAKTIRVEKSV